ncbi:hypothetical protein A2U01_0064765, partial [Trifolium medium]|nr:hypothetical protein [Trifolium medium]
MVDLLGSEAFDAHIEDDESYERHRHWALIVYLLLLVGYTIFAYTSKNSVHLHYL